MSYTRRFSRTISVPYSGSVSYPASESGGTRSYSGTEHVEVEFEIEVDTNPFDNSIAECNSAARALTASVVATNAAEVASIAAASNKIGTTIVEGFFKNVKSELSQQIVELQHRVDARLALLQEQSKTLQEKKSQMETDYERKKVDYEKIFNDLNQELYNRVHALDQPTFDFSEMVKSQGDRMLAADYVEKATVSTSELAKVHASIKAAQGKNEAMGVLNQVNKFLKVNKATDRVIKRNVLDTAKEGEHFYLPVCFIEKTASKGVVEHDYTFDVNKLPKSVNDKVETMVMANPGNEFSEALRNNVEQYFKAEVGKMYTTDSNTHDERVKNVIYQLFNS